jgi:hypothetical protein
MWFTSKAPAFKNEDWGTPNFKTIQSPGHPPSMFMFAVRYFDVDILKGKEYFVGSLPH